MPSFKITILTILGCGLATWLSRVLPFVLLKKFTLPKRVVDFLSFVPIVIMASLWFSNLLIGNPGHLPKLNTEYLFASIPTFISAIISKSLLVIVVVGIVSLALIRLT